MEKISDLLRNKWKRRTIIAGFVLLTLWFLLPFLLPFISSCLYGVSNNENAQQHPLCDYGLIGDSYGILNTLFSGLAFFGLLITLYKQYVNEKKAQLENRFYKMLECQQNIINEMSVYPVIVNNANVPNAVKGRKVFVEYKIQLKYLLKGIAIISEEEKLGLSKTDIADIAYAVFYYGSSPTWKPMMMEYLKDYKNTEQLVDAIIKKIEIVRAKKYALNRPNQNYLSVYCRNMYNAIKVIDSSTFLDEKDKIGYIKILRAQLSNAELYVLFFNLISRFGKKWIENDYVEKYQLIQNIPAKYCDGYDPKEYFPRIAFESEEKLVSPFQEVIKRRS